MDKLQNEKHIVKLMIEIYCKKQHRTKGMCDSCEKLLDYAHERAEKCPFKQSKTFCSNCQTHCYKPEMREKIREVMRFSGPRMIFYHPKEALKHLLTQRKRKNEN